MAQRFKGALKRLNMMVLVGMFTFLQCIWFLVGKDGGVILLRHALIGGECISILVDFDFLLVLFLNSPHITIIINTTYQWNLEPILTPSQDLTSLLSSPGKICPTFASWVKEDFRLFSPFEDCSFF